jgi:hypothetical protein
MFRSWIVEKPVAAALLAAAILVLPAAAQQPAAPASPFDFTLHSAESGEAQPQPLPLFPEKPRPCEEAFACRARLVGELWKKGGVALDITPFRW